MTAVDQCASCGADLSLGARFCRSCGAAVEATEVSAGSPDAAADTSRPCPSCAAPVSAGAAFCRSCGERLRGRRGRGPLIAAGAFVACLALGGLVGGGAYLFTNDGGSDASGGGTKRGGGQGIGDGDDGSSSGGGGGSGPTDTPIHSGETSPLLSGRYIQAGSFRSPEGAGREVDRLVGEGIDVEAVPADWADELLPGFQVLLVGPLATTGEEKQALRQLEDASVAGFARDLTPSGELSGPAAAAGSWGGDLEQSYLRGTRSPRIYRVDFTLAPDGESGTVDYPGRGCHGSLTLSEESGFSLAYLESIESGGCRPGGVWHLRPEGAVITAVRLYDDLDVQVMVDGEVAAVEG